MVDIEHTGASRGAALPRQPAPGVARPAARPGVAAGTIAFFVLACGLPLQVVFQSETTIYDLATLLQLATVVYAAIHLASLVMRGRPHLMEFFFWLYVYVWLGLAPFAQLLNDRTPVPSLFPRGISVQATTAILVGIIAYDVGQWWARRTPGGSAVERVMTRRELSWPRLRLLLAMIVVSAPVLIRMLGGVRTLFVSRETAFRALTAVGQSDGLVEYNLLKAMLTVPALVAMLGFIHLKRRRAPGAPTPMGYFLCIGFLVALNLVVNNPIANPRYWAGTVLGASLLVWKPLRNRSVARLGALAVIFVLLFAFPYADYFRYEDVRYRDTQLKDSTEQFVSNLDYDSYPQVQNAVHYAQERGHTMGKQSSGAVVFWVPRGWWADKPLPTGEVLAEAMGWPYTNLSAPVWAELYVDYGFFAIAPVFVFLGLLSRRLDHAYDATLREHRGVVQVLVPVLAVYQLILLRGALLPLSGPIVFLVALTFALTRRRRVASSADGAA